MKVGHTFSQILVFAGLLNFASAAQPVVPVMHLSDSINVGVKEHFMRALEAARASKAPALLIEMDTPGGFLDTTREMVQAMLASEVPILVWVAPQGARAASAGSMLTMAAHYAAMAESTSIGAATPVSGDGSEMTKEMRAKVENDTVSWVEGIAEKRGRDKAWAVASVKEAASLTSRKALEKKVIDGVHASRDEVWKGARAKIQQLPEDVRFEDFDRNLRETVLSTLSNPNVAYGLMALGTLGIYVEITHPGLVIPGALGAISLALGAITMQIIPIRPGAIALLIVGLILAAIEILTPIPTFGVAGAGALLCFLLSGIFLMDSSQTSLGLDAGIWLPLFFTMAAFGVLLGRFAMKALQAKPTPLGEGALNGREATVAKALADGNFTVSIQGEIWTAELHPQGPPPPAGTHVVVTGQSGLKLFVSKKES
jgi:membrane-bound serine protease (ClpP class)